MIKKMHQTNVKTPYADKYTQSEINSEVKTNAGAKEYWKPTFREGRAKFVSLAKRKKIHDFCWEVSDWDNHTYYPQNTIKGAGNKKGKYFTYDSLIGNKILGQTYIDMIPTLYFHKIPPMSFWNVSIGEVNAEGKVQAFSIAPYDYEWFFVKKENAERIKTLKESKFKFDFAISDPRFMIKSDKHGLIEENVPEVGYLEVKGFFTNSGVEDIIKNSKKKGVELEFMGETIRLNYAVRTGAIHKKAGHQNLHSDFRDWIRMINKHHGGHIREVEDI